MTIRRGNVASRYTKVSNSVAQDMSISPEAKGVWLYLVSQRSDWDVFPKWLAKEMGIGRDKMYKILNELIEHRLCRREQARKRLESGREVAGNMEYVIYGEPEEWMDVQLPDFQDADLQEAGRHDTTKEYKKEERNIEQQLLPEVVSPQIIDLPKKSVVVVPSECLALGADEDSYSRLLEVCTEASIFKACEVAQSQNMIPQNFFGWMKKCIEKGFEPKATASSNAGKHQKWWNENHRCYEGELIPGVIRCDRTRIGIEFRTEGSGGKNNEVLYEDSDFVDKIKAKIGQIRSFPGFVQPKRR